VIEKIAIPLTLSESDTLLNPHFGRSKSFLIINDGAKELLMVAEQGGKQIARKLIDHGITSLIVLQIGEDPFTLFERKGVKVYAALKNGSIDEQLQCFAKGDLTPAKESDIIHKSHHHSH